jgi:serine/threonine protein kinase
MANPSEPLTPRVYLVYISEQLLGKGSFGTVDKVINMSNSSINAHKTFLEPHWGRQNKRQIRQKKEEWLEGIHKEIHIMRNHPHVSMT